MKAILNNKEIEITSRTENGEVIFANSENREMRLMIRFQKIFDLKNNQITDFSFLPVKNEVKVNLSTSRSEKKDSKLVTLLGKIENFDFENNIK